LDAWAIEVERIGSDNFPCDNVVHLGLETGELVSEMVIAEFHLAPTATSELRNYRTVNLQMLRTDSAEFD